MRLFIGLPLADEVAAQLTALCGWLRSNADGLRWSAPESWHITLQFLGSATAEQFECLKMQLAGVRAAPFAVRLGGLGVFDQAGVLLVKVEVTPQLIVLERRVVEATARCGFEPEERPYQPHITLARSKGDGGRRQLKAVKSLAPGQPEFAAFPAREFLLYESHLGTGGSRYEVRERFALTRAAS